MFKKNRKAVCELSSNVVKCVGNALTTVENVGGMIK